MKKIFQYTNIINLFIIFLFFLFFLFFLLSYYYKNKEGFSISDNEIISSVKETFNNIFNPIKRTFRIHYNNLYDNIEHNIKKFNYHY